MKVIIVGAGIGGLATALRLHHKGIDCEVHEQGEQVKELGVGVNTLRAVRERLGPGAVRTGHRLTAFEQDTGGVRAHFTDRAGAASAPVHGDVLVAADGIHSTVRSVLFPAEGPPICNGVMMWRGAADWPEFGAGRTVIIAGGTDAKLVVYPIAPGGRPGTRLTNWALCLRTGRPGDPAPQRQDWSRRADTAGLDGAAARFHVPLLEHAALVRATRECSEFPMCDRDPLPYRTRGRVTLLGDAAHPMYPMDSNGAGQAILDATSLSTGEPPRRRPGGCPGHPN